jgi:phosphate transport system substrate-binding protein
MHLHGSNTLGFSVVPRLAKAFLETQGAAEVFVNDESRAKERVWVQARLAGVDTSIEIYAPGTKVGFDSLEKGWCDLVLASRPITSDEATRLESVGDLTGPASENVIAMDGIAVIVHPSNPVTKLTMKQLEEVFSGKTKSWAQLGGKTSTIHAFARDEKSGTHDGFVSLVMPGKQTKTDKVFEDSEALVAAVAKDESAIGFVGLSYVKQTKALAIQDGGVRAVPPTPFSIATEEYPLARRLFFYAPPAAKNPMTKELVEFALSDEGQAIVNEAGFVPLSLRAETSPVPPNAPPRYAKLAAGATRLSVSFRFKKGTASLDAKARRDLDRLIKHVNSPINRGRHVALAAFSDGQGNDAADERVAKQGLDAVASLLAKKGVTPDETATFGSALPVASNDSPDGRARNRRVEVWLH